MIFLPPRTHAVRIVWFVFIVVCLSGNRFARSTDPLAPPTPPNEDTKPGSVRVYRFDNLDIEGKVKTPQLLYFLKRIRNKFRSFRLPDPSLNEKTLETKNADFL